jgi:DNA replication protein DnaC
MRAIENGFSVCFTRVDELVYQLKADANISPARLKHKKYMASNLLILDEFGYQPLDREAANLLFRVVRTRGSRVGRRCWRVMKCSPERSWIVSFTVRRC